MVSKTGGKTIFQSAGLGGANRLTHQAAPHPGSPELIGAAASPVHQARYAGVLVLNPSSQLLSDEAEHILDLVIDEMAEEARALAKAGLNGYVY